MRATKLNKESDRFELEIIETCDKPDITNKANAHVRIRHDHATWHENHVDMVIAMKNNKLPFERKSRFSSYETAHEAIDESANYPAAVSRDNGNLVTTFDMGYDVGYDYDSKEIFSLSLIHI